MAVERLARAAAFHRHESSLQPSLIYDELVLIMHILLSPISATRPTALPIALNALLRFALVTL